MLEAVLGVYGIAASTQACDLLYDKRSEPLTGPTPPPSARRKTRRVGYLIPEKILPRRFATSDGVLGNVEGLGCVVVARRERAVRQAAADVVRGCGPGTYLQTAAQTREEAHAASFCTFSKRKAAIV